MCAWTPLRATRRYPSASKGASTAPSFDGLGKIAQIGIRVSRHCTYHGVSLNVAMDLDPLRINPVGIRGLQTVDLSTIGVSAPWQDAADVLGQSKARHPPYLAPPLKSP